MGSKCEWNGHYRWLRWMACWGTWVGLATTAWGQAGFGGSPLDHIDFQGVVRVTTSKKIDGIAADSRSMAGLVISEPTDREPRQVVVTSSLLREAQGEQEDPELQKDGVVEYQVQLVNTGPDPVRLSARAGSGYGGYSAPGGAGSGYGGGYTSVDSQAQFTVQFRGEAEGLLFFLISGAGPLPVTNLAKEAELDVHGNAAYSLENSTSPESLEIESAVPGTVVMVTDSLPTKCVGLVTRSSQSAAPALVGRKKILQAWAKVRATPAPPLPGVEFPGSLAAPGANTLLDPATGALGSPMASVAGPAAGSAPTSSMQSAAMELTDWISKAVMRHEVASTPNEKQQAARAVRDALAIQFDAQRQLKKMELDELRQRLEQLTKDEETRIKDKDKILDQRVDELLRQKSNP